MVTWRTLKNYRTEKLGGGRCIGVCTVWWVDTCQYMAVSIEDELVSQISLIGVCTVWWVIQDSQGDQPMADGTFLSKIKIYVSIYLSIGMGVSWDNMLDFGNIF